MPTEIRLLLRLKVHHLIALYSPLSGCKMINLSGGVSVLASKGNMINSTHERAFLPLGKLGNSEVDCDLYRDPASSFPCHRTWAT